MKKRPLHVAEASWRQISLELRATAFRRPQPKPEQSEAEKLTKLAEDDIVVMREEVTKVTTVQARRSKWIFRS